MSDVERFEREYGCSPDAYAERRKRQEAESYARRTSPEWPDPLGLNADLDPRPLRVHDSEEHPRYRMTEGIPFEQIKIDPRALTFAADEYEAATGHVDEIALCHAILGYLESERS